MIRNDKTRIIDKEKLAHERTHLVRPPRLEGVVKEAMMQPVRKKKRVEVQPVKGVLSVRRKKH